MTPDTPEGVIEEGRESRILSARFDIDEDGSDELFVYLGFGLYCGTAGCDTPVLERVSDELRELTEDKRHEALPTLRDEDRAMYFTRTDPRWRRLVDKYGFPTGILDGWEDTLRDAPVVGAEYVAPDRAREARYWPPDVIQRVDDEMRRRVGSKWDDIVREAREHPKPPTESDK